MRDGGCDLFPEADAYSYVKGLPVKHLVTEKHLQACIGLLCTAYTFAWSRWNATRVPRQIVIQFKELHGCIAKQVFFQTSSHFLFVATSISFCIQNKILKFLVSKEKIDPSYPKHYFLKL